jgi:predicted AAA+ superfamily ATPase
MHVAALYHRHPVTVSYFRGDRKGKEIDIVVDFHGSRKILIEVKYREDISITEKHGNRGI